MITRCTKRDGILTITLLVLAVAGTWWLHDYTDQLKTDLYTKKTEIATFESHKQNAKEAEDLASEVAEDRDKLQPYVLTENGTVTFLTNLEDMARAGGVDLVTESLTAVEDADIPHVELHLTTKGNVNSLSLFLERLENINYVSWIESISWARTDFSATADIVLNIVLLPS